MITYLFPGQGSQKKGMGKDLFPLYPDLINKADDILGYSIEDLCLNSDESLLTKTKNAQPAIYVVNALNYYADIEKYSSLPDYVVGHSLGEYNALLASSVFDFETGLKIVKKRGELMSEAVGGSMAAVIGLSIEKINQIIIDNNLYIDIANINSPGQIVISGKVNDIVNSEDLFINGGAKSYIILKVGGAFHSRYMNEAATKLKDFISDIDFHLPQIPVISNLTAKPYNFDKESIVNNLSMQLNNPVRWTESMDYLIEKENMNFHEIGNTQILIGMLNKIQRLKKSRT